MRWRGPGWARGETVNDAGQQLTDRLARLRGGGAGFSRTAASVSAAVAAVPGAEITGLSFDSNRQVARQSGGGEPGPDRRRPDAARGSGLQRRAEHVHGHRRAADRRADGEPAMIARFRTWFDGAQPAREVDDPVHARAARRDDRVAGRSADRRCAVVGAAAQCRCRDPAGADARRRSTRSGRCAVRGPRCRRGRSTRSSGNRPRRPGSRSIRSRRTGNKLRVHLNSARGGALLAWLGELEGQGVLVDQLNVTDAGNHNVAADITFRMMAS